MELTLARWFAELDEHQAPIPLAVLTRDIQRLRVNLEAVREFLVFSTERYRRNLIHAGPMYQALLLCWRSGQASPIHDHRGSACAVRVIRGEATETVYEMTEEGRVFAVKTHKLAEGFTCATEDLDIHKLANDQPPGKDLVTLHLYSPPLLKMGQYSMDDPGMWEFHDEVYAVGGEGI